MTRYQVEQMAISLRAAGWPIVSVEMNNDGMWRAVAESIGGDNRHLRRLPRAGLLLVFLAGLRLAFAAVARFGFFLAAAVFAFGAARFDFVTAAARLRLALGAAAFDFPPAPARLRLAKYSIIGSK